MARDRAAWAEWAAWTCKERQRSLLPDAQSLVDRKAPVGKPAGVFLCARFAMSPSAHASKGIARIIRTRDDLKREGWYRSSVATPAISPTGISKCLRRILPSAWSARQRTLSPIRHASRFAPPRTTSGRCGKSGPACPSRTGSSWSAIRVCGCSAFVDRLTNSSAIVRMRDDGRMREFEAPAGNPAGRFSIFASHHFHARRQGLHPGSAVQHAGSGGQRSLSGLDCACDADL